MLSMGPRLQWLPPIVTTSAVKGDGTADVVEAVERHRKYLESSGEGTTRAELRLKDEAADLVAEWARSEARRLLDNDPELAGRLLRDKTPYSAAEEIRACLTTT